MTSDELVAALGTGKHTKRVVVLLGALELGGAEKQAVLLANGLSRSVHVTLVVLRGHRTSDRLLSMVSRDVALVLIGGGIVARLMSVYQILSREQPTAVFSFLAYANAIATVLGKLSGVKRIYPSIRSAKLPPVKLFVERLLIRPLSSRVVFNSERAKEAIFGPRSKKGVVIYNCIDERPRRTSGAPIGRPPVVVCVARFSPEKDIETALRAVALLRKANFAVKFRLIGYGRLEPAIRKSITDLELTDNVELIVDPPNVAELVATSDIALSTSIVEGLSNSLIEAAAAGLPIVATDVGDTSVIVEDGVNGFLVEPRNPKECAEGILRICTDADLYKRFSCSSVELCHRKFGVHVFLERYLSLL